MSTTSPPASPSEVAPVSPEQLADSLADALERSDYERLRVLIAPTGWVGGFYQSEGTPRMTPDETIAWLKSKTADGRLHVQVERRPILPWQSYQPLGDFYIRSVWMEFHGTPRQNVDLILRAVSGKWYWSGALFNAPR